ncbi:MAG: alpha-ketoglutarate-dependent dioxygenase AlkB [Ferruginibacter sp.]
MQRSLFETPENMLPFEGEVFFYPAFFNLEESDQFYQHLLTEVNWKQEPIKIFGKEIMQPRLTAWYGEAAKPYSYSGITMQTNEWTPLLLNIKQRIEAVAKVNFTGALLNQYRGGQDSMGWHRDNEKELGINPVIGSVSFGASRKFQLRHYTDKTIVRNIHLTPGSFLLMQGETQHHWEHRAPKTARDPGTRINITFRVIR